MLTTTLNNIRACHPCSDGYRMLLAHLKKKEPDDAPIPFSTIVASNGIEDAVWCTRAEMLTRVHRNAWRFFLVKMADTAVKAADIEDKREYDSYILLLNNYLKLSPSQQDSRHHFSSLHYYLETRVDDLTKGIRKNGAWGKSASEELKRLRWERFVYSYLAFASCPDEGYYPNVAECPDRNASLAEAPFRALIFSELGITAPLLSRYKKMLMFQHIIRIASNN